MKLLIAIVILLCSLSAHGVAQYYYPPLVDDEWERIDYHSLNWQTERVDDLLHYLREKNSKSFIILKNGRIVIEEYFDGFGPDSLFYLASAVKSVIGVLVGMAQSDGLLNIGMRSSDYLGEGWTDCPPDKEALITLRHQLSMTSGLDDDPPPTAEIPDPLNCLEPRCLQYLQDAGTRWAYHNSPYHLLQDVLEEASEQSISELTRRYLRNNIGMRSIWSGYAMFARARDMARFGLLILSRGVWDAKVILSDDEYFKQMLNSSQNLNPSYGYLWWLNGKGSYKLPRLERRFSTDLIPAAPDDLVAALGKNDQKIYVVPSLDMVVVRQGDSAGESLLALSTFDNELWTRIMQLEEPAVGVDEPEVSAAEVLLAPVPASSSVTISFGAPGTAFNLRVVNSLGQSVFEGSFNNGELLNVNEWPSGSYTVYIQSDGSWRVSKLIKQ